MSEPIFKINGNDYTQYVAWDSGIKPADNDLDADGSGRNILDGLMYRSLIATKMTLTISMNRIDETVMAALKADLKSGENFITITWNDAGTETTFTAYNSTLTEGSQKYINGTLVYDDVSFDVIER